MDSVVSITRSVRLRTPAAVVAVTLTLPSKVISTDLLFMNSARNTEKLIPLFIRRIGIDSKLMVSCGFHPSLILRRGLFSTPTGEFPRIDEKGNSTCHTVLEHYLKGKKRNVDRRISSQRICYRGHHSFVHQRSLVV